MKRSSWLFLIIILIVLAGGYAFLFFLSHPKCYDGYGSGVYGSKEELMKNLNTTYTGSSPFPYVLINTTKVAMEIYRCEDTKYLIKEKDNFKKVSKEIFEKFIQEKNTQCNDCIVRVHSSGNSPIFVDEIHSGKRYYLEINNHTYILVESRY